jgi:hypothetical protein
MQGAQMRGRGDGDLTTETGGDVRAWRWPERTGRRPERTGSGRAGSLAAAKGERSSEHGWTGDQRPLWARVALLWAWVGRRWWLASSPPSAGVGTIQLRLWASGPPPRAWKVVCKCGGQWWAAACRRGGRWRAGAVRDGIWWLWRMKWVGPAGGRAQDKIHRTYDGWNQKWAIVD